MSDILQASQVKEAILQNKGVPIDAGVTINVGAIKATRDSAKEGVLRDLKASLLMLDAIRKGSGESVGMDLSFADFVQQKWGYSPTEIQLPNGEKMSVPESFLLSLDINPSLATVQKLYSLGDINEGYRWIVPEIVREALRLGLRRSPIYPNLIRGEETVSQTSVKMPVINLSDMMPRKLGEMETIATGTVSFNQKESKISKYGMGIKMSDEVIQYSTLNLLAIAMEDMGVLFSVGLDALAINTLLNGDQADGSDSVGVIGVVTTGSGITYFDLLRAWVTMSRIGMLPDAIISNVAPALALLQLPEFKGYAGQTTAPQRINFKTPLPTVQDYYISGAMPDTDYTLLVNSMSAMLKLNAVPLRVEMDRDPSRQMEVTYATVTTGFATLKRDARLLIDDAQTFSTYPAWFDVDAYELMSFQ